MERKPYISDYIPNDPAEIVHHKPTNPLVRQALAEAAVMVGETLNGADIRTASLVLYSRRRVTYTLDGDRSSTFNSGHHNLDDRIQDIVYDLASFRGEKVKPHEVKRALMVITCLETAFYPYANAKARLFPNSELDRAVDRDEIECTAKTGIERAVWDIWDLDEKMTPEQIYQSLEGLVKGYLFHLPSIVALKNHGGRGRHILGFEDLRERRHVDDDTDILDLLTIPEQVKTNLSEFEAAEAVWYAMASKLKLPQAFYLIEKLEPRLQLAVLDKFGYINADKSQKEKLSM